MSQVRTGLAFQHPNAHIEALISSFMYMQRMVCLQSPDKATFFVPWEVAMRSTVVKQMLEGDFVFNFFRM
jgi:hypothetical protein